MDRIFIVRDGKYVTYFRGDADGKRRALECGLDVVLNSDLYVDAEKASIEKLYHSDMLDTLEVALKHTRGGVLSEAPLL